MKESILSYQQKDSIRLQWEIDLKKLFSAPKQRERFNQNWKNVKESDPHNNEIFELEGDLLKLSVEELNEHRKNQLLNLSYDSPFRIGRCVFISMPGAPSGPWPEPGTLLNVRCHDSTL